MATRSQCKTHPAVRDLIRSLAAVALCLVAVHLLAGCGGGDPDPDVPAPHISCTAGVCK